VGKEMMIGCINKRDGKRIMRQRREGNKGMKRIEEAKNRGE
jgi:hypothetical protein